MCLMRVGAYDEMYDEKKCLRGRARSDKKYCPVVKGYDSAQECCLGATQCCRGVLKHRSRGKGVLTGISYAIPFPPGKEGKG
jgi:hypothetical protein